MKRTLFIVVSLLFLSTGLAAQSPEKIWNFDGDKTGEIPTGFTNETGDWKIAADPSAPSQPNVLAQLAKNSDSTFNLILVKETNYKNVDVSVKMKAIAGQEDQGGGLIWRARDAKNYYVARYNPLEDNYRLYIVEKGSAFKFKPTSNTATAGIPCGVTMKNDRIQCFYDGKKVLEAKDSTFQEPGKIGRWTKADAQSHFDDLKIIGNKVTEQTPNPSFREAFEVLAETGIDIFGGPTGQIAIMHQELVEKKKWISNTPVPSGPQLLHAPAGSGSKTVGHYIRHAPAECCSGRETKRRRARLHQAATARDRRTRR